MRERSRAAPPRGRALRLVAPKPFSCPGSRILPGLLPSPRPVPRTRPRVQATKPPAPKLRCLRGRQPRRTRDGKRSLRADCRRRASLRSDPSIPPHLPRGPFLRPVRQVFRLDRRVQPRRESPTGRFELTCQVPAPCRSGFSGARPTLKSCCRSGRHRRLGQCNLILEDSIGTN